MSRKSTENSRAALHRNGWKIIRIYIEPRLKDEVEKYQANNNIENLDMTINKLLDEVL